MNNLEILLHILIHPYYAIRRGEKSLGLSIIVVAVAVWSTTVSDYLIRGVWVSPHLFSFSFILRFTITLFSILIAVSLWHVVSETFRGKGRVGELFPSICLCFLPYIFLSPAALIISSLGTGLTSYWSFFKFLIILWVIILQIFSLKIIYELNGLVAALSYFTPVLLLFAILLLAFLLMVSILIIMTSQALSGLLPVLNM
ncbi:MAG TPA: hypothetical protein EYP78_00275 [Candidatus Omnitrophica bacterium]|nr:hypothetical protein [Candidatus Omnitrophota bacterium]